ncbi:glycosyltransferase [Shewanella xiamenensis]|uniref:glycosyltransferase n=1 Tax=Shewanella xiamenensis TaxID=332186 RepID=UPI000D64ECD7|nr:glycosyltransferase [Shewanella xiamenensis]MCT8858005.1 glycosyltransferase [Shewanella xiamenensis]PWH04404.1 sugar transferase [Shewanella xiamenensis]UWG63473.1 glycosyltransferase [Shewanella xiamenensis]
MLTQKSLAPVVLFVYARADHTQRTLTALAANPEAIDTDLIIYADAARDDKDAVKVQSVRDVISNVKGFKSVTLHLREQNIGLARNIIEGVSNVAQQYGRVIVLEDDIVTSPAFLGFMNAALEKYKTEPKVWHISGWNYPIETDGLGDAFFWRLMNCWGWATWADRWQHFNKEPQRLIDSWSDKQKHNFDLDGTGVFWSQVTNNKIGKINTWAIFWYATIYENGGVCLNPSKSYVDNIGLDGSGVHCGNSKTLTTVQNQLCITSQWTWPLEMVESPQAVEAIKLYYKKQQKSFIVRATNKLARLLIGKNIF